MIHVKNINIHTPHYREMRELRNQVLLRPLGIPDHSWEMHDERSWHFVALQDDQVIGCAVLVPSEENKTSAQLIQMAVASDVQGKGIGQLLLTEIIAFAKRKFLQEIHCHSRQYAVNFYKKAGFTVYGETFTEVGIPHNYMKLELL